MMVWFESQSKYQLIGFAASVVVYVRLEVSPP